MKQNHAESAWTMEHRLTNTQNDIQYLNDETRVKLYIKTPENTLIYKLENYKWSRIYKHYNIKIKNIELQIRHNWKYMN